MPHSPRKNQIHIHSYGLADPARAEGPAIPTSRRLLLASYPGVLLLNTQAFVQVSTAVELDQLWAVILNPVCQAARTCEGGCSW